MHYIKERNDMKKGFTLAELLIVLGITGVVVAVLLPAINNLMPDKTKIMYLKSYDALNASLKTLTSNSSLFPSVLTDSNVDIDVTQLPLLSNAKPLVKKFNDDKYSGSKKLCNLIAFTMDAESDNKCDSTNYPTTPSFITKNGMKWWISETTREINTSEQSASYQTDIYVDVDPSKKSENCMYGETECKNPDTFKFLLAADGTLIPADPVGMKYIETRKQWLKKKYTISGDVLANLDSSLLNIKYKEVKDDEVVCPPGQILDSGVCKEQQEEPPVCSGGKVLVNGVCSCPSGTVEEGGVCKEAPNPPVTREKKTVYIDMSIRRYENESAGCYVDAIGADRPICFMILMQPASGYSWNYWLVPPVANIRGTQPNNFTLINGFRPLNSMAYSNYIKIYGWDEVKINKLYLKCDIDHQHNNCDKDNLINEDRENKYVIRPDVNLPVSSENIIYVNTDMVMRADTLYGAMPEPATTYYAKYN